jgi:hypothetical protein
VSGVIPTRTPHAAADDGVHEGIGTVTRPGAVRAQAPRGGPPGASGQVDEGAPHQCGHPGEPLAQRTVRRFAECADPPSGDDEQHRQDDSDEDVAGVHAGQHQQIDCGERDDANHGRHAISQVIRPSVSSVFPTFPVILSSR